MFGNKPTAASAKAPAQYIVIFIPSGSPKYLSGLQGAA